MGRPSDYTPELAAEICDRLAGGEPLQAICSSSDAMPDPKTVRRWRDAHPEFRLSYARAREDAGDAWAERALAAAMKADPVTAAAARVKFDALRWYASKLAPKVYGDKLQHANAAGDGDQTTRIIYGWEPPPDIEPPA
jgi:hypothetical protein